jgi:hypothetical protein
MLDLSRFGSIVVSPPRAFVCLIDRSGSEGFDFFYTLIDCFHRRQTQKVTLSTEGVYAYFR